MIVTVKEFRSKVREMFELVEGGEEIKISRRGKVYTLSLDGGKKVYTSDKTGEKGVHFDTKKEKGVHSENVKLVKTPEDVKGNGKFGPDAYGCGCKFELSNKLCKKHGRY